MCTKECFIILLMDLTVLERDIKCTQLPEKNMLHTIWKTSWISMGVFNLAYNFLLQRILCLKFSNTRTQKEREGFFSHLMKS